jgi:hypothetical protein
MQCCGPGCLSRIRIFPSRIHDPGSKRFWISDPDPHQRIQLFLIQKIVFKLSKYYPDVYPGSRILIFYPSRIQGSKRHRMPDPDPQHWEYVYLFSEICTDNFYYFQNIFTVCLFCRRRQKRRRPWKKSSTPLIEITQHLSTGNTLVIF